MAREETHKSEEEPTVDDAAHQLAFDEPKKTKSDKPSQDIALEENSEAQQPEAADSSPSPAVEPDSKPAEETSSIKADTHARNKKSKKRAKKASAIIPAQKRWQKVLTLGAGLAAVLALLVSGIASQYYKNKVMPNVLVAGVQTGGKTEAQITNLIKEKQSQLKISLESGEKKFEPKFEEIGFQVNTQQTVKDVLRAKRDQGILAKLAVWKKVDVPVAVTVNDTLLNQYVETRLPELAKAPQDSRLEFDAKKGQFFITKQADGSGSNTVLLKQQLENLAHTMQPAVLTVQVTKKSPAITEAKLKPLLNPASQLVEHKIVLSGLGYTFQAKPADIASWLTPTPQPDGSLKLVVDEAKVQSYIQTVSKRISNAPVDRKVIKDEQTGAEVVIQEGRAGTELADQQTLVGAITTALKNGQDTVQSMNIKTADFQTVNMEAVDKWIEVDLSEQRTTAYERATPVKNFIIASGTKGHETVTGEFSIWLKVRKQTMQGGSRADGSYYSIPNVEWVSYFYKDYALHGAWWREKFGVPASHGCVNMTNTDAQWVYEWAPVGTKVIVHQ